ncbi:4011_t:CDS:1, partial [Dentiscutata heterogama]
IITFILITFAIADGYHHKIHYHRRHFHKPHRNQHEYHHPPVKTVTITTTKHCAQNVLCRQDFTWSQSECKCIPKTTTPATTPTMHCDPIYCPQGSIWKKSECKCIPMTKTGISTTTSIKHCVQNMMCMKDFVWDQSECKCVQKSTTTDADAARTNSPIETRNTRPLPNRET